MVPDQVYCYLWVFVETITTLFAGKIIRFLYLACHNKIMHGKMHKKNIQIHISYIAKKYHYDYCRLETSAKSYLLIIYDLSVTLSAS